MACIPLAIVAVLLVAYAWWRDHRNAARLRTCAQERRLRFSRHDLLDVHRRHGGLALMRVGHSRRAWNTFFGTHETGPWVGFFEQCDVGFGGDRAVLCRCAAAIEVPTGIEAVCVPTAMEKVEPMFVRTPMGCLSFFPAQPAGESGRGGRSHQLHIRRSSAAASPFVASLMAVIARHPADWMWEVGETVIMAAAALPAGRSDADLMAALLDAVVAAARGLPSTSRANG